MKKYLYVLIIVALGLLLVACDNTNATKKPESKPVSSEISEKIFTLSERVNVESFVDEVYLDDGGLDDEARIIYSDKTEDSNFTISEFTEYDSDPSHETIKKIRDVHIPQLEKVRDEVNKAIVIRSASRSISHELRQGRKGASQHVYKNGQGAVDVSLVNYSEKNLNLLENAILDTTNYTRVARYQTFIHVDFAKNRSGERGYYRNTKYGWVYIGEIL